MIWVTWRQFRATILAGVLTPLVLAALAVTITVTVGGHQPGEAFLGSGFQCFGVSTTQCITDGVLTLASLSTIALPVILGIFVGVTVFSRDIERRTHVLGLSQSVSLSRWYWSRILVVFVPIVVAMVVLGFAVFWSQYRIESGTYGFAGFYDSRLSFPAFGAVGLVPAGYTALGLTVGAAVALLLRHTIGAMIMTLVAMVAMLVLFPTTIREHYATPQVDSVSLEKQLFNGGYATYSNSLGSLYPRWTVGSDYVDSNGQPVPTTYETCAPSDDSWPQPIDDETNSDYEARIDVALDEQTRVRAECFRALGIDHFETRYHEDRLLWRFQVIETALCALLAAILAVGSTRLVGRLRP